ncbi:hypothetical protein MKEN_01110800 [Mycena kentingensis (nom. inval.)]|nr:hypothetical protein MKEN_01110800 [Mycena kentingensis (nom. inval.)]
MVLRRRDGGGGGGSGGGDKNPPPPQGGPQGPTLTTTFILPSKGDKNPDHWKTITDWAKSEDAHIVDFSHAFVQPAATPQTVVVEFQEKPFNLVTAFITSVAGQAGNGAPTTQGTDHAAPTGTSPNASPPATPVVVVSSQPTLLISGEAETAHTASGEESAATGSANSQSPHKGSDDSDSGPGTDSEGTSTNTATAPPLASNSSTAISGGFTSSSTAAPGPIGASKASSNNRTIAIATSMTIVTVLLLLGAFFLYRRRRRARERDRREWEQTHADIADAVREVDGPARLDALWGRIVVPKERVPINAGGVYGEAQNEKAAEMRRLSSNASGTSLAESEMDSARSSLDSSGGKTRRGGFTVL